MNETSKTTGTKQRKRTQSYRQHSVKTKCEAVLSIWAERRMPAELCRELGINWAVLSQWQNKALEGMIQALEPKINGEVKNPALCPKLEQRLLKKMAKREPKLSKLEQRLTSILADKQTKEEARS